MSFKPHFYTVAIFILCNLVSVFPAYAGQLFPPQNLSDPTQDCPNGAVLSWSGKSGTVVCANPTAGITLSCPKGQVLRGINNGAPVCEEVQAIYIPLGEKIYPPLPNHIKCGYDGTYPDNQVVYHIDEVATISGTTIYIYRTGKDMGQYGRWWLGFDKDGNAVKAVGDTDCADLSIAALTSAGRTSD